MLTRDQMAYNESTADPIFLFQRARYVYFRDTMTNKGLRIDEDADYQVYDPEDPINEKALTARKGGDEDAALIYLTDDQLVQWECAVKHWETEYVFLSREESDAWGVRRKYDHGAEGVDWRTYCVCARGTLAQLLDSWSDSCRHQLRTRPPVPPSPDPVSNTMAPPSTL